MEYEIKAFYERIKAKCKEKGISQIELCESCGINLQSHRGRITKNVAPDVFDACSIARTLETSVEYLVTGKYQNAKIDTSKLLDYLHKATEEAEKI